MIHSVTCNQEGFKNVYFSPNFNVILSDITDLSTEKDSRNGTGKTTLINIIHYCLGSNHTGIFRHSELYDWIFTLTLDLLGRQFQVSRNTADYKRVIIEGPISVLNYRDAESSSYLEISNTQWIKLLGTVLFGLEERTEYLPAPRSLLSYFIRRNYTGPFTNYPQQLTWDKQVHNTFLLGLNWEDASAWQILKDRKKVLNQLKREIDAGTLPILKGNIGDLEATKVLSENKAKVFRDQIKNFKVHPQYTEIQLVANELTKQIHEITNEAYNQRSILSVYKKSIEQEIPPESDAVIKLYESAGIELPIMVVRNLNEVINFHNEILKNRRQFLQDEIHQITDKILNLDEQIEKITLIRAEKLEILDTHGALEEYSKLQSNLNELEAEINELISQIDNLKKMEDGKSALKVDTAILEQKAKRSLGELNLAREKAIELFNKNSEALYELPGKLIIDITSTGFKFNIDIERMGSTGIGNMNIFCYDFVIAELWADKKPSPGFLVHDSNIFDGVDSRQVAHAIELASRSTVQNGFQYILMMNSDNIPYNDFSLGFDIEPFVRLRLGDDSPSAGILGKRI